MRRIVLCLLLVSLLSVSLSACAPSVTANVPPAAMAEADRYLSMIKVKWAGTMPGSIDSISEPKQATETDYGWEIVYEITFHNGLVQKNYLELQHNPDGSFSARAMRNYK